MAKNLPQIQQTPYKLKIFEVSRYISFIMKSFSECHFPPTSNSNTNQCFENSKVVLFTEWHVKWLYAKLETNVKYINNKNLSKLNRNKSSCKKKSTPKTHLAKLYAAYLNRSFLTSCTNSNCYPHFKPECVSTNAT